MSGSLNEYQRDQIVDQLPKSFPIVDADLDLGRVPGTLESWADAMGHDLDKQRRCQTCGRGQTCVFMAFYEALISSVVRELNDQGRLMPSGVLLVPKGQAYVNGVPVGTVEDTRGPVTWCEHGPEQHGPETGCVECRCLWPKGHERVPMGQVQIRTVTTPEPTDRELNDPFGLWGPSPSYRCGVGRHRDCEPDGAESGCTCECGHQNPMCACNSREVDLSGNRIHYLGCPMESQ